MFKCFACLKCKSKEEAEENTTPEPQRKLDKHEENIDREIRVLYQRKGAGKVAEAKKPGKGDSEKEEYMKDVNEITQKLKNLRLE